MNDSIKNTELPKAEVVVFTGGCFCCMEAVFELIPGIVSLEPGYTVRNILLSSQSNNFSDPIVTKLEKLSEFYVAEEYHHKYFKKN